MDPKIDSPEHVLKLISRRNFVERALAGTAIAAFSGASLVLADGLTKTARAEARKDGRPRLPPGQRAVERLKAMGGEEGDPSPGAFRLKVHGLVESPLNLDFAALTALPQVTETADVHCVTGWSLLGPEWTGVRISELARRAGVKPDARYVIFEGAHGYTSNVPIADAMKDSTLIAHHLDGRALARANGAPARAVVPDLYFWKSAKWITGIRFVKRDEPGFWEVRGYNNHGDPWKEERYG